MLCRYFSNFRVYFAFLEGNYPEFAKMVVFLMEVSLCIIYQRFVATKIFEMFANLRSTSKFQIGLPVSKKMDLLNPKTKVWQTFGVEDQLEQKQFGKLKKFAKLPVKFRKLKKFAKCLPNLCRKINNNILEKSKKINY